MMRPNFDEPINTIEQMVEKGMITYDIPWSTRLKDFLDDSPLPVYNELAKTVFTPKDWDDFDYYTLNYVMGEGTMAQVAGYLYPSELAMGRWWKSKETISGFNPFGGALSDKKWILNEVSNY